MGVIPINKPTRRPRQKPQTLSDVGRELKQRVRASKAPAPKPEPVVVAPPAPVVYACEVDVAEGLEGIAWRELKAVFDDRVQRTNPAARPGALRFQYTGNPYQLLKLTTVQSVYFVRHFAVPRPKALLGDQHFKALLGMIDSVRQLAPAGAYQSLYISAAGSDSSVMTRLKTELAEKAGLTANDDEGDLLLRLRRGPDDEGWEALVRLSPRPLATRAWRVCNREGALNAAVAQAMVQLSEPTPDDVYLNMGCGSGTLLIERLLAGEAKSVVGYDLDPAALECARQNRDAAGFAEQIKLNLGDVHDLPLPARSIDVITADLPFGQLVGSHEANLTLYPAWLAEAARIAKPRARAVFISHEVRLMEGLLEESRHWKSEHTYRVGLGGMHPRIWVLTKK